MHILKEACYMTASFPAIYFFYGSVIISREHLKQSTYQGLCVYFTTLVAAVHYNKRSLVDSRKFEGYVYWKKNIVALLFKGAYLFHRTNCSNFCLRSTALNTRKYFPILSFFNWTTVTTAIAIIH